MNSIMKRNLIALCSLLLFMIFIGGCVSVKLISDYDETVDKQINDLYKNISAYMLDLSNKPQVSADEKLIRENNFNDIILQIKAIKIRAMAKEGNDLQIQQVDILLDSWNKIGELQKTPLTKEIVLNAQSGLEITVTAILKLEIAKRR